MTDQLAAADLASMTPQQIDEAHRAGRCNALLGMNPDDAAAITRATDDLIDHNDVARLARLGRHDLIDGAHKAGRIVNELPAIKRTND